MRAYGGSAAAVRRPWRRVLIPDLPALPAVQRGPLFELRWEGRAMGTVWRARAFAGPQAAAAREEIRRGVEREIDLVVRQMSHFDPHSDLSRYNGAKPGEWVAVPAEFFTVLRCAVEIARATCGWFDPTVGEAVDLWGFGARERAAPPSPSELAAARQRSGWHRLRLDPRREAVFQPGGLQLNLSAIAKGYAVDRVAEYLERRGDWSELVELEGKLRGFSVKPEGDPWWVLLESPSHGAAALPETLLALHNVSVASSGDWVRRRTCGRAEVSHLIDPDTSEPQKRAVAGASVVHESCMLADAWATALSVAPPRAALRLADCYGLCARIVYEDGDGLVRERLSSGMEAMAA